MARILRTLSEIGEYMGLSPTTVAGYIEQGLPATRIGAAWITSTDLIDKWILSRHLEDVRAKRETRALRRMRQAAVQRMLEAAQPQIGERDE